MSENSVNNSNIIFILRCCLALLLALQVWVWLRFGGALWVSDSLDLMESLTKSVSPIKTALQGFLIFVVPVLAASFIVYKQLTAGKIVLVSVLLGIVFSTLYLFTISFMNLAFIKQQIGVYVAAGSLSGLAYGTLLVFPWGKSPSPANISADSRIRRRLLGSIGLLAGATGLTGSLMGPFYFWRNRDTYIDVELGPLEEGQMVVVKLANRPVWIIKRSPELISRLRRENGQLRDPHSEYSQQPELAKNSLRSIRPEYLVVVGLCTHLGCVPTYLPDSGGSYISSEPQFFCPCHGGAFDLAGRVFNGTPPPENMIIPDHEYVSENVVRLYFPSLEEEWSG